ncbi:PREDICTED: uncharacterized protein LOC108509486 [Lepidothrix coronata]|uniref:Uncharacterized protein LOC108509486 n=1 Tax=Lepidothrix coronata TaxID=321398 RepID=A0A6J0J661_9PASS|nr:PREDICTED: uncharacterized protein LOC108509486 [Lepidothrix coronata]
MPSLPQDSPAGGLGTGFPLVRVHGGDRSDLLSLYVTTYEASFGKRPPGLSHKFEGRVLGVKPPNQASVHPLLGVHSGSGYVTNNYSALSSLITPRPECPDPFVSMSATSEDFRPFGRPQFQRILPQCVDEPECSYPPEFSLSRIRYEGLKPPKLSRGSSANSGCSSPAQPGMDLGGGGSRESSLGGFGVSGPQGKLCSQEGFGVLGCQEKLHPHQSLGSWWFQAQLHPQEGLGSWWFQAQLHPQEGLSYWDPRENFIPRKILGS